MLYLVLSIICSVTVGVIFKTARRFSVSVIQIIFWNYIFALLLCYSAFDHDMKGVDSTTPWTLYGILAILMPSIFLFLAASIRHMGIVRTDVAQRLSLFIPILAAYFLFGESFNILKIIGLLIGFPAMWLILSRKEGKHNNKWIYPAVVLLGFGIIDVMFKQIAIYTHLPFTTSLLLIFCGTLIVAFAFLSYESLVLRKKPAVINFAFGSMVGIFNFGNIFFYLKAHQVFFNNPSTVFAAMNMGVIVLGSFAGILLFREKMTILNYAGIFLALAAILFITLSQAYS